METFIALGILGAVILGGQIYPKQTMIAVIVVIALILIFPFIPRDMSALCR